MFKILNGFVIHPGLVNIFFLDFSVPNRRTNPSNTFYINTQISNYATINAPINT